MGREEIAQERLCGSDGKYVKILLCCFLRRCTNRLRKNSICTQYNTGILHEDIDVNIAAGCSKRPSSKAADEARTGGVPSGVR